MNLRPRYVAEAAHDGARPLHLVMDVSQARPRPLIALAADTPEAQTQAATLAAELSEIDVQIRALQDQHRTLLSRHAAQPGTRRPLPPPAGYAPRDTNKTVMLVRREMAGLTLPEAMHLLDVRGWGWKLTSVRGADGEITYLARVFRPDVQCVGKKMTDQQPVAALTEAWASAEQLLNSAAWVNAQRASLAGLSPSKKSA